MAVRNSTIYLNKDVNKYAYDARDFGGRVVKIKIKHTVVSGELGGASAGVSDEVNLCTLPANCEVFDFFLDHEAMGASAGAGVTAEVGDSGDVNRYMTSTDVDAAGQVSRLVTAGVNYRPTVDTIVLLQWGGANPVVGKIIEGFFLIVPGA